MADLQNSILLNQLSSWLDQFDSHILDESFLNSGSRFFYGHLLLSLMLILCWCVISRQSSRTGLSLLFRRKYWWNSSTIKDYQWISLNAVIKLIIGFLSVYLGARLSYFISEPLHFLLGETLSLKIHTLSLILFLGFLILIDDFLRFLQHFAFHSRTQLRRWHGVHHSAEILTPLTLLRIHPIEMACAMARNFLMASFSTALYQKCFGRLPSFEFLYLSMMINGLINALGAPLRHSPYPISFGILEYVLVSPAMHQLHHDLSERPDAHPLSETNFGVTFSIWDQLCGTFQPSKPYRALLIQKYNDLLISTRGKI